MIIIRDVGCREDKKREGKGDASMERKIGWKGIYEKLRMQRK